MLKFYINSLISFSKGPPEKREEAAFICFIASFLMFFWELGGVLVFFVSKSLKMCSNIMTFVVSGAYILVINPLVKVTELFAKRR